MEIKIKPILNGCVVSYIGLEEDEIVKEVAYTYEDDSDKDWILKMFYDVLDAISINQKYEKENVSISIVHGRGFECEDKTCKICNP